MMTEQIITNIVPGVCARTNSVKEETKRKNEWMKLKYVLNAFIINGSN